MPALPLAGALFVRTDFSDDGAWDQVQEEAQREYGPDGFQAYIDLEDNSSACSLMAQHCQSLALSSN
jgi:hypothetical protein